MIQVWGPQLFRNCIECRVQPSGAGSGRRRDPGAHPGTERWSSGGSAHGCARGRQPASGVERPFVVEGAVLLRAGRAAEAEGVAARGKRLSFTALRLDPRGLSPAPPAWSRGAGLARKETRAHTAHSDPSSPAQAPRRTPFLSDAACR